MDAVGKLKSGHAEIRARRRDSYVFSRWSENEGVALKHGLNRGPNFCEMRVTRTQVIELRLEFCGPQQGALRGAQD